MMTFGAGGMTFGAGRMTFGAGRMTFGAGRMTFGAGRMTFGAHLVDLHIAFLCRSKVYFDTKFLLQTSQLNDSLTSVCFDNT